MSDPTSHRQNPPSDDAERIRWYVDKLPDILGSFEESHPQWQPGILISILEWALLSLKRYIEDPTEQEISWDEPFVEIRFPVDCTKDGKGDELGEIYKVTTGALTSDEVRDDESAKRALSALMVRHLEIVTLQDLTEGLGMITKGEGFIPVIPDHVAEPLMVIEDEAKRHREMMKLFRPLSFGAGTIDYGDLDIENTDGCPVPSDVSDQLGKIMEPLISIPMEANGNPIQLITIFEIHPLVIDPETLKGYFPIVVGLAIQSRSGGHVGIDWIEHSWASFSGWPEEERAKVWGWLSQSIKVALEEVGFGAEPEFEEAFLTISATIKVVAPTGRMNEGIDAVLRNLRNAGDVLKFGIERQCPTTSPNDRTSEWLPLLDAVDGAGNNKVKGEALERLMVSMFESVPGFDVSSNVRTQTEEIDLWIENSSTVPVLSKEGSEILVECKNWKEKTGKNEFVIFREKLRNRGARCTLGFLVSWSGFAETTTKEMLRGSTGSILVVPMDGAMIREAVSSGDFLKALLSARRLALEV